MASSKSYATQVGDAHVMLGGLKTNKKELEKRGINDEFISLFETVMSDIITQNNRQERLKAELKTSTATLNALLEKLRKIMSESNVVVKLQMPKSQWKEFGIQAKK